MLAAAKAKLARSQADLDLLKSGSWEYDRDVTKAALARAEAEVAKIEVELDRLVVRALVAGRVLQVNVRPGEFVGTPANQPLVILGNTDRLHVRVDIDEYDIPRFHEGCLPWPCPGATSNSGIRWSSCGWSPSWCPRSR